MEERASALVAAHLQKLGIEVRTKIAKTGVVGVLKGGKPGPLVAFCAYMDALPLKEETGLRSASKTMANCVGKMTGVKHGCGHDAHTAILTGVAETLVGMREELAGSVTFIFQPAKEGSKLYSGAFGGGAKPMNDEGLFRNFSPAGAAASFFHEFDLAFGDARKLDVVSNKCDFLRRSNPLLMAYSAFSKSRRYKRFLEKLEPRVNKGFFRQYLDIIIRKP